jgi:hypothetical protein
MRKTIQDLRVKSEDSIFLFFTLYSLLFTLYSFVSGIAS